MEHEHAQGLSNTLHAGADACCTAEITITDTLGNTVRCDVADLVLSLAWDPQNPQGIEPDSQIGLSVLNGRGPFSWEMIEGTKNGFVLNEDATGATNVLIAGADICVNATIRV